MQRYTVYFIWKLLYVSGGTTIPPPIIRSTNNCIYSIMSDRYCYLPLWRQVAVTVWQIPEAVDTVVCAPDDGWWYKPKHVEQFPDKINCVTLHLVGYTWSVRKVSDLWPGKRNWLTWSVGHLITLKVVPLGLHTLLPAVPPLLEACRKSLFRNGV